MRERFAKVDIQASEPIVPFRETAIKAPDMAPPKTMGAPRGTMHGTSSHSLATFTVRAIPLPQAITSFLQTNQSIISHLERESQRESHDNQHDQAENGGTNDLAAESFSGKEADEEAAIAHGELLQKPNVKVEEFWDAFKEVAKSAGGEWAKHAEHVWSFGPNRIGPNLLLDCRPEEERWYVYMTSSFVSTNSLVRHDRSTCKRHEPPTTISRTILDYESSLESGFQIATLQGPLCAEPVQGMAYLVESVKATEPDAQDGDGMRSSFIIGMKLIYT